MAGPCSRYGRDEKCIPTFLRQNLKNRVPFGDLEADGKIYWNRSIRNGL
jgi:hypothetical protein